MRRNLSLLVSLFAIGLALIKVALLPHSTTGASPERDKRDRMLAPLARMGEEVSMGAAGRGVRWMNLSYGRSLLRSYLGDESGARTTAAALGGTPMPAMMATVAAIIEVTNTNNGGMGSLREAIVRANLNPGPDTIVFNIPTTDSGFANGTYKIGLVETQLRLNDNETTIDGTTQPGYQGTPIIEVIQGRFRNFLVDALTGGVGGPVRGNVFELFGDNIIIRGLRITGPTIGDGINIQGNSNVIENNIIDISGRAVVIDRGSGNLVGGLTSDKGNVISGFHGVEIKSNNNIVQNNKIGDIQGTPHHLVESGIDISHSSGNFIIHNTIAFWREGVRISGGEGNVITANSIHSNKTLGIELLGLKGDGVDPVDPGDPDVGPNLHQNFPTLLSARKNADGSVQVKGILESTPNTTFTIEFFSNPECDPPHLHGEGKTFIGSIVVTTDSSGRAEFDVPLQGVGAGAFITSTATDPMNNTSELSGCVAPEETCTVTTTNPVGPGSILICMQLANSNAGFDVIGFNLTTSDPGYNSSTGVWTIRPFFLLPPITTDLAIVATQPIVLDGSNITTQPTAAGLTGVAGNITLRGLTITGFANGVVLRAPGTLITESSFNGNRFNGVLAVNSNGHYIAHNTAFNNGDTGFRFSNSDSNMFVDNRSSGNGGYGASFENGANGNVVLLNRFGIDSTGTSGIGNNLGALYIFDSSGNIIGSVGFGNTFAASALSTTPNVKVLVTGAGSQNNRFSGNFWGTDPTRTLNLGNPNTVGLSIESGAGNTSILNNVFANERNAIVTRSAGSGNSWLGNSIYRSVFFAIDINSNGPSIAGLPVLSSVAQSNSTRIQATLTGRPDALYTLDFFANRTCHPLGFGEGQFPIGSATVLTDGNGNVNFDGVTQGTAPAGYFITATATDPDGNTTELSRCTPVVGTKLADIALSKTGPAAVSAGQRIEYTIEANNVGEASALEAVVTDELPACLTQIVCNTSQGECLVTGNRVVARFGVINETEKATLTIRATVNESCGTLLTNTAHVSAEGDPNAVNDAATVDTSLGPANQPPLAQARDVTVMAGQDCTANASIDDGSSDPDGDPLIITQTPAGPYPLGNTEVTLTVTDSQGAASQATATVTVIDITPPTLVAPAAVNATTGGAGSTSAGAFISDVALGTASASDNCSQSVNVTRSGVPPGNFFPVGTTTITYLATDASGNAATATQYVVVSDDTPPVVNVPANMTLNATSPAGASVNYTATANDNLGVTSFNCTPVTGSIFPIGTTTVNCNASDAAGNNATNSFQVRVRGAAEQIVELLELARGLPLPPVLRAQLLAALQTALANPRNLPAACRGLTAFIALVRSQAGRSIPVDRANQIITDATRIKAVLGCP